VSGARSWDERIAQAEEVPIQHLAHQADLSDRDWSVWWTIKNDGSSSLVVNIDRPGSNILIPMVTEHLDAASTRRALTNVVRDREEHVERLYAEQHRLQRQMADVERELQAAGVAT
jgi:hypothetical protein